MTTRQDIERDLRYLTLLSGTFPNVAKASTEIINLQAILNLPKGTEHFLADLHGEFNAFQHVLRNASGNIKRKVNDIFGDELSAAEKRDLCTLIYYPEQKLELIKAQNAAPDEWYRATIRRLVRVCRDVSGKYTRSKVRKALPPDFSYIIEELLHEHTDDTDKAAYVRGITDTIIDTGRADDFVVAICLVIGRLIIDRLHILGDIYDRGPGAHRILDMLGDYRDWDIQWGNHDILWMGAVAGNDACLCNVIRLSLRYANMATLEEGYGVNLVPLAAFAMETYKDDPCEEFLPKTDGGAERPDAKNARLIAQMHKAITVLQFKAEAQILRRHPEWHMDGRRLLKAINFEAGTCLVEGRIYKMRSCLFPTIDPADPEAFTAEEAALMEKIHHAFQVSEKLHRHIKLLLSHGCMYSIVNHNLLFHASVPLNEDGTLREVELRPGQRYSGRQLMHQTGMLIRSAFQSDSTSEERAYATDYFLYLWCGPDSTLFNKSKMATFERYFLSDKETYVEEKGWYFRLRDNAAVVDRILDAFGVQGSDRHIINGHVPVHASGGENPIKADGKLMVIDGGFSQPYHAETGIAGYTLVYHSRGFQLVQHAPFTGIDDAVIHGTDIKSTTQIVEMSARRMLVADTDKGDELRRQIADLRKLLYAYRHGYIEEKR